MQAWRKLRWLERSRADQVLEVLKRWTVILALGGVGMTGYAEGWPTPGPATGLRGTYRALWTSLSADVGESFVSERPKPVLLPRSSENERTGTFSIDARRCVTSARSKDDFRQQTVVLGGRPVFVAWESDLDASTTRAASGSIGRADDVWSPADVFGWASLLRAADGEPVTLGGLASGLGKPIVRKASTGITMSARDERGESFEATWDDRGRLEGVRRKSDLRPTDAPYTLTDRAWTATAWKKRGDMFVPVRGTFVSKWESGDRDLPPLRSESTGTWEIGDLRDGVDPVPKPPVGMTFTDLSTDGKVVKTILAPAPAPTPFPFLALGSGVLALGFVAWGIRRMVRGAKKNRTHPAS